MPQHTRSAFLAGASALLLSAPAAAASLESIADPDTAASMSADQALKLLMDGNARFRNGTMEHPNQTPARRREVAPKQAPFACVVSCSDSRVPPEVVFDRGLGDLFVSRVAGNTADDVVTGSVEYAVEHFHTPLLMVLGHQRCGACAATLDTLHDGVLPADAVASVVRAILPVARTISPGPDELERLVDANARATAATLGMSPVLHAAAGKGALRVVTARYDLDSGTVVLL
ncbi:MAG TPA: carbonic anhydrase [Candidatus Limnocylindria bacterium]|nr:carbonic anhydrase [Candidatus Limnocylindria bacterium]